MAYISVRIVLCLTLLSVSRSFFTSDFERIFGSLVSHFSGYISSQIISCLSKKREKNNFNTQVNCLCLDTESPFWILCCKYSSMSFLCIFDIVIDISFRNILSTLKYVLCVFGEYLLRVSQSQKAHTDSF